MKMSLLSTWNRACPVDDLLFRKIKLSENRLAKMHRVAEDDLELPAFTSLFWDYRHGPSCLIYVVLGMEPRILCVLDKHSTV